MNALTQYIKNLYIPKLLGDPIPIVLDEKNLYKISIVNNVIEYGLKDGQPRFDSRMRLIISNNIYSKFIVFDTLNDCIDALVFDSDAIYVISIETQGTQYMCCVYHGKFGIVRLILKKIGEINLMFYPMSEDELPKSEEETSKESDNQ